MGDLEINLSDRTVQALRAEGDLLGFDTTEAYLSWLVANRFALEVDSERGRLLAEYADRANELDVGADGTVVADSGIEEGSGQSQETDAGSVVRIEDDELAQATDALATVRGQQLDEFARRAVAETRERLGEGAASGIAYNSRTDIGNEDRRPGEDITDLDDLDVPGYDDELIERRREAVGAAVAFLRDVEQARRSDFVSELYETYPAGYESVHGWWECIKRGLRQIDRVNPAREDSRTWEFLTVPGRVTRLPR